ncbi:MAG: RIP metalloprotease RseP [Zetaproteobacteria bacterium]|nr:MAG: RIP metalloprotease RseP [Zetaproteobacteria bacterium]
MDILSLIQETGQNIWIYGGAFIIVLSVLVFVHEWGHYIVARMCGVHVNMFSIGFGREIWGFNDKSGTRWKLSLIPLGGYVQLFGDTDPASAGHSDIIEESDGKSHEMTQAERDIAFFTKPVWQRAAVVFAGPAINYIFAIILLTGLYVAHGKPVSPPTAAAIIGGSSADKHGFVPHDIIVSIDGKNINSFSDIRREMMVALDEERHFVIKRGDELVDIKAKPERLAIEDRFGFKSSIGLLGLISAEQGILISRITHVDGVEIDTSEAALAAIKNRLDTTFMISMMRGDDRQNMIISPVSSMNQHLGTAENVELEGLYLSNLPAKTYSPHTVMTAIQAAINESYVMTRSSLEALWQMIVGVRSATELGGIIRIGAIAGDMAQQGIVPLILLMALLSINLGFINLLPIPMLDGGHLMFYFFESVLGKPVPEQIQEYAFRAGFFFLIGLMAFANLNDLYQLLI